MNTFSVIIPAYNAAEHLKETIDSVLCQTYKDFELIVIDDGSIDDTPDILQKINDCRLKIITQTNQGVSAARNRGIDEANGQYIAFLDSDDLWNKHHLENAICFFKKNKDIVWYASLYTHDKSSFDSNSNVKRQYKVTNYFKGGFLYVHSSTVVVATSEIKRHAIRFREDVSNAEDWIVWNMFANIHCNVGYNIEEEVFYRLRTNSLTHSNKDYRQLLPYLHFLKESALNKTNSKEQNLFLKYKILERWLVILKYKSSQSFKLNLRINFWEEYVILFLFFRLNFPPKLFAYLITKMERKYQQNLINLTK